MPLRELFGEYTHGQRIGVPSCRPPVNTTGKRTSLLVFRPAALAPAHGRIYRRRGVLRQRALGGATAGDAATALAAGIARAVVVVRGRRAAHRGEQGGDALARLAGISLWRARHRGCCSRAHGYMIMQRIAARPRELAAASPWPPKVSLLFNLAPMNSPFCLAPMCLCAARTKRAAMWLMMNTSALAAETRRHAAGMRASTGGQGVSRRATWPVARSWQT